MTVTGGRVFPTTIVVTPNTALAFKNFDPFKHRPKEQCTAGALRAESPDVDVVNLSIGGLPAMNDGSDALALLYDEIIEHKVAGAVL